MWLVFAFFAVRFLKKGILRKKKVILLGQSLWRLKTFILFVITNNSLYHKNDEEVLF